MEGQRKFKERKGHLDIKSTQFRVVYADGVIGGITPSGMIHMAFFNERQAIPRRIVHKANPDGTLGKEIESDRVSRDSIIRELETDLIVSLKFAKSLHKWLGDHIREIENTEDNRESEK